MATRKQTAKKPATRKITASKTNVQRALKELDINKPYYTARVVGGRLELRLYGGDVVLWPADREV